MLKNKCIFIFLNKIARNSPFMIYKLCLYLLFVFLFVNSSAQNKQILYDFDQLPQTLMLNPGAEVDYDKHFGIPLLSSIYFQIGATNKNITYNDIYSGTNSNSDILRNIYEQNLGNSDYFEINQQLEMINAGFRLKNPDYYLSFGMYQELDGYSSYPKDLVDMFYQGDFNKNGNIQMDEKSSFDNINFIGELVGVFHVGLSVKINKKLNLGARFKILSGSLNINSVNNQGHYVLNNDISGYNYNHKFNQMNILTNSSGLIDGEGISVLGSFSEIVGGLFFMEGNYGLGLDLGMTYHASENIIVTASLLDLDYVSYNNDKVTTYKISEDFNLPNNDPFDPTYGNELSYWENILDLGDFENSTIVPIEVLSKGYNANRTPKVNTSIKYQIFNKGKTAYNSVYRNSYFVTPEKDILLTEFGIQTYTAFRPNKIDWAVTAFYSREINKYLNTKITYTYSKFSAKNIGLGISTHFNKINFYATADNLLNLFKIKDSNYQSFQFGLNFIFK